MKLLLLLATLCLSCSTSYADTFELRSPVEKISKALSSTERQVRAAAVKVVTPRGGHGSGSLIKYKDLTLVFTARHVANDPIGTTYLITKNNNQSTAALIYQSDTADIAVLILNTDFRDKNIKPMDWDITSDYDIGKGIVYSGYPSSHKLMSFNGRIVGYETDRHGTQLIVNTYGWFGCSGSVIYDEKGTIIGILYGVDVEYHPGIQINENMIWVAPIKHIDMQEVLKPLCRGTLKKYKACQ